MFANLVYARLAAACPDAEAREKLDRELSAPAGGWDAAEASLMAALAARAGEVT